MISSTMLRAQVIQTDRLTQAIILSLITPIHLLIQQLFAILPRGGHTMIQIIDALGRVVRTPLNNSNHELGNYSIVFDSTGLPAGVYYARLQNGTLQQVKPILKVRG